MADYASGSLNGATRAHAATEGFANINQASLSQLLHDAAPRPRQTRYYGAVSNRPHQHEAASRHHRRATWPFLVALASLPLADGAPAQTSACDRFKATLAERITPGGFTLEAVPAGEAVPSGAKVVGTCEGGARKILLRRPGPATAASATVAAPAPQPIAAPAAPAPVTPAVAVEPKPDPRPVETARAAVPPPPPPEPAAPVAEPTAPRTDDAWLRYAPWLLAPLLVLLAGALWAWIAHHRAYDAAGLPRGPRLD